MRRCQREVLYCPEGLLQRVRQFLPWLGVGVTFAIQQRIVCHTQISGIPLPAASWCSNKYTSVESSGSFSSKVALQYLHQNFYR